MHWAYPFGMLHLETQLPYYEEAQARERGARSQRETEIPG